MKPLNFTSLTVAGKTFLNIAALLTSLVCLSIHATAHAADPAAKSYVKPAGEVFVPLKAGETNLFSYGLYTLKSEAPSFKNTSQSIDLILVVRNNGAKYIGFENVTHTNFTLLDANDCPMQFWLKSTLTNIGLAYGATGLIHLDVPRAKESPQPWALDFKSPTNAFVPFHLSIREIKLSVSDASK